MPSSMRQRFLDYVRHVPGARPVVSPFLPNPGVIAECLRTLGLPVGEDELQNEVRLARALDYEPMFMTDCMGQILRWHADAEHSNERWDAWAIDTPRGPWRCRTSRTYGAWGDSSGFAVQTEQDHEMLALVCDQVSRHEAEIRRYYREWRERVGDDGVIVIGHPHITSLAYQIGQENLIYHYLDYPDAYRRSEEALLAASQYVFGIALEEGIDFMSESTYALEMVSPSFVDAEDLPYLQRLADWTHAQGGLFWYHNCGMTRWMFVTGRMSAIHADVIETVAPPPEGDNDLAESRRALDRATCTKGNLSLRTLRDGAVPQVIAETRALVEATRGWPHIVSTADAVLPNTPPENLIAFVRTARELLS